MSSTIDDKIKKEIKEAKEILVRYDFEAAARQIHNEAMIDASCIILRILKLSQEELKAIFGTISIKDLVTQYTLHVLNNMIEKYYEKNHIFNQFDECFDKFNLKKGIITNSKYDKEYGMILLNILYEDYTTKQFKSKLNETKLEYTGKHYISIDEFFKANKKEDYCEYE